MIYLGGDQRAKKRCKRGKNVDSGKGKKWARRYKIRWRTKQGGKPLMEGVQMPSCGPNTTGDAGGSSAWRTRWSLHQVDPQDFMWEGAVKMCKLIRNDRLGTLILSAGRKTIELQLNKCFILRFLYSNIISGLILVISYRIVTLYYLQ